MGQNDYHSIGTSYSSIAIMPSQIRPLLPVKGVDCYV